MSVRIRPQAQIDILELADRLGEPYPNVGRALLTRVDETVQFLERFPAVGSLPPVPLPADPAVRFFPVQRFREFLIAFLPLPDGDGVEIVRVIDGRRDLASLIDGE